MLATDRQTGAVFAGVQGGLYVSTDSGTTWTSLAGSPTSLSAMAISYSAPSTIYVGTFSNGLHRSTDGGATWVQQSTGLPGAVLTLAVHPANSSIVYAGSGSGGLFKTTNGGAVWSALSMSGLGTSSVTQIVTDPNNPEHVYLALVSGLARSTDGGATWQLLTAGLATREMFRVALAADSTLYVAPFSDGIWKYLTAANDPPLAQSQTVTTAEDTPAGITLTATDPDAEPLTFSIVAMPAHGTLSITGTSVIYSPAPNYHGPDGFTFVANDGRANSAPATVSITVTPVNDAPVAQARNLTLDEDTLALLTLQATDGDGDSLTFSILTGPSHGTLTGSAPNFTYTPAANYYGADAVTFRATDPSGATSDATVTITVAPVNDAPVAVAQSVTTAEDTAPPILLGASDVDGDALTTSIAVTPLKGTLSGAGPSRTYTPLPNFRGTDTFTFSVSDGTASSSAVVTITVTPSNDAPIAAAQSVVTVEDTPVGLTLWGSDLDGDPVTFTIVSGPSHGALSGTAPNLIYTPAANYSGADSFTFKVNDGTIDSPVAPVTITVGGERFVLASPDVRVVTAVVSSPVDPSVVYATTAQGVFRST